MGLKMRDGLMGANASQSNPLPHELRWYQFSLRSIFVVTTLFALALGLYIKYVKQAGEQWARIHYFLLTVGNSDNNVEWLKKPAKWRGCSSESSSEGWGRSEQGNGSRVYSIQNSTGNEPANCLAAFMGYFAETGLFDGPQSIEISENRMILKSPEGSLEMEAKWLPDEPSQIEDLRRMQLKWKFEFRPLYPPSEEQATP
jgi:hypothetical protein